MADGEFQEWMAIDEDITTTARQTEDDICEAVIPQAHKWLEKSMMKKVMVMVITMAPIHLKSLRMLKAAGIRCFAMAFSTSQWTSKNLMIMKDLLMNS